MDDRFADQHSLQDRIAEGMRTVRFALDQEAPRLALAAVRETARAALLVLGQGRPEPGAQEPGAQEGGAQEGGAPGWTPRRPGKADLALLREVATATPQRFADCSAGREALARAALALLDRLFPHPAPAAEHGDEGRPGRPPGLGRHPPALARRAARSSWE